MSRMTRFDYFLLLFLCIATATQYQHCSWLEDKECSGRGRNVALKDKTDCILECQNTRNCKCISWNEKSDPDKPCRMVWSSDVRDHGEYSDFEAYIIDGCTGVGVYEAKDMTTLSTDLKRNNLWTTFYYQEHSNYPIKQMNDAHEKAWERFNNQIDLCFQNFMSGELNGINVGSQPDTMNDVSIEEWTGKCHIDMEKFSDEILPENKYYEKEAKMKALNYAIKDKKVTPAITKAINNIFNVAVTESTFGIKEEAYGIVGMTKWKDITKSSTWKNVVKSSKPLGSLASRSAMTALKTTGTGLIPTIAVMGTNAMMEEVGVKDPKTREKIANGVGMFVAAGVGFATGGPAGAAIGAAVHVAGWFIGNTIKALFRTGRGPSDNWAYFYVGDVASKKGLFVKTYKEDDTMRWISYSRHRFFSQQSGFLSSGNPQDKPFQVQIWEGGKKITTFFRVFYRDAFFVSRENGKLVIVYARGGFNTDNPGLTERWEYDYDGNIHDMGEEEEPVTTWLFQRCSNCYCGTPAGMNGVYMALAMGATTPNHCSLLVQANPLCGSYMYVKNNYENNGWADHCGCLTAQGEKVCVKSQIPGLTIGNLYELVKSPSCYIYNTRGNGKCHEPWDYWVEDAWGKHYADSYKSYDNCMARKAQHDVHCGTKSKFCFDTDIQHCNALLDEKEPVVSGDKIYLKAHTGSYIQVNGEAVQVADNKGDWEVLTIERPNGQAIASGDTVYFRTHTQRHIDVENESVHARYDDQGAWQAFVIEKKDSAVGDIIYADDTIYLMAKHTGKFIEVEGTTVGARYNERGDWQAFVIEYATGTEESTLNSYLALNANEEFVVYGLAFVGLVAMLLLLKSTFQRNNYKAIDEASKLDISSAEL